MEKTLRIVVDAMGGDNFPQAPVEGAVQAGKASEGFEVILAGKEEILTEELKKYGFKYLGTVTVYSHLQACGIINDHAEGCPCYHIINDSNPTVRKRRWLEK